MGPRHTPLALGCALCALCACEPAPRDDATLGELGRVEFRYQRSCFFGCPLEQPLLVGTRERISVDGPGDSEGISVSSDDPDALEVALARDCFCQREDGSPGRLEIADDAACDGVWEKHCDNDVLVAAHDAGDFALELHDADGELVDRTTVRAREADRARFDATFPDRLGSVEGDSFELQQGQTLELEVELYDADGKVLLAPEGVAWSVLDASVAVLDAWLIGRGAEVDAGLSLELEAVAQGETRVAVAVPGLDSGVDVRVLQP